MSLKYVYDDKEAEISFPLDGEIIVHSNPFFLYYSISSEICEQLSASTTKKHISKIEYTANWDKPLSETDGVLAHEIGKIKLEVKKGRIFLMDKSIEEYL
jgi:hypothetical protein